MAFWVVKETRPDGYYLLFGRVGDTVWGPERAERPWVTYCVRWSGKDEPTTLATADTIAARRAAASPRQTPPSPTPWMTCGVGATL